MLVVPVARRDRPARDAADSAPPQDVPAGAAADPGTAAAPAAESGAAPKPRRTRLDVLLVERELCPTRARAQALIVAGKVLVDERVVDKPGTTIAGDAAVRLRDADHPFVSRGGVKLQAALDQFGPQGLEVRGRVAVDIGASTGGFTDCLLQAGAARVHAVDVGYGQLAWRLASDTRVVVHDRLHVRHLDSVALGERCELAVIDCSFIALAKVIRHVPRVLGDRAEVVALVKPQFELEPDAVGKGGIVRDEAARADALARAAAASEAVGLRVRGAIPSPITGRDGNVEYLLWLTWERRPDGPPEREAEPAGPPSGTLGR